MCNAVNTFWNIILMKITTQVCKSSIMGPHLGRILLKRSHFPHCKAFDLQVRKALFRLWKHWIEQNERTESKFFLREVTMEIWSVHGMTSHYTLRKTQRTRYSLQHLVISLWRTSSGADIQHGGGDSEVQPSQVRDQQRTAPKPDPPGCDFSYKRHWRKVNFLSL